jgi:hypothetical protein
MVNRRIKGKLKIGIMLDSFQVQRWIYKILLDINKSDYAEISLLIIKNENYVRSTFGIPRKTNIEFKKILFEIFKAVDFHLYKTKDNPCEIIDAGNTLRDIKTVIVNPRNNHAAFDFEEDEIRKIEAYSLDVIVNFSFGRLVGEILDLPRYGVWAHNLDDSNTGNGEYVNRH